MRTFHFITGMPRSGSTLLGGILKQNPRFSAGMSSPLGGLVTAVMRVANDGEFSGTISEEKTAHLIRSLMETYYEDEAGAQVIFDTNRLWAAHLPLVAALAPEAKVIACVRNPAWVMDSVEQIVRRNPLRRSRMFNNDAERATVFSRAEALIRQDRLIGFAWAALREAYFSAEADRLLLVEYDILCQRPKETLELIYQFIGEPWFEHDFENVEYSAEDFDEKLNTPGLHTVGRKVEFRPRNTILPPDVFERFANMAFWRERCRTKANKIVQAVDEVAAATK